MSEAALTALPLPTGLDLLWRVARPHTRPLTLALVLGLAASAMDLVSPLATKWILDALDAGASLAVPVLILAGLLVVGALVSWWQWVLLGTLDRRGRRLHQGPRRDGTGPAAAGARAATGDGPL